MVRTILWATLSAELQINIMHFVVQASKLAQMYIDAMRTFSDIEPLEILPSCPPYWNSKWPPFETYIFDYLWA